MKNQYFADKRDFFKYDLLFFLKERISILRSLTLIPMLTPNDHSTQGRLTRYECEGQNISLFNFLQTCLQNGHRDIRMLRQFFSEYNIPYYPYRDDLFFTHESRAEYFGGVPDAMLHNAVVLLDPDIGFETRNASSLRQNEKEKYLFWSDLRSLAERPSARTSLFLVYQHLQRNKGRVCEDLRQKGSRFATVIGTEHALCVRDHDLVFLAGSADRCIARAAEEAMTHYAARHTLRFWPSTRLMPLQQFHETKKGAQCRQIPASVIYQRRRSGCT